MDFVCVLKVVLMYVLLVFLILLYLCYSDNFWVFFLNLFVEYNVLYKFLYVFCFEIIKLCLVIIIFLN